MPPKQDKTDKNMNRNKTSLPKAGEWIEITARNCGERISPLLKVGARFVVRATAALKDGTPVVEVAHPSRKRAVLRVNAARFAWRVVTLDALREDRFKKQIAETTAHMSTAFSIDELGCIAFVPLILNRVAWNYAMRAIELCAAYRVELLKKIVRQVRALAAEYDREIAKDLDYRHRQEIAKEADRFVAETQKDFTILYFTVNQEFKRKMPTYPYDDLRTLAIISLLMIRLVDTHNRHSDALIASRFGPSAPTRRMPAMDVLYTCMDAIAGEIGKFDYANKDVVMAVKVIENNIRKIQFKVV